MSEHKFLADLQPYGALLGSRVIIPTMLNWAALFGATYIVGYGLRLGWGS